LPEFYQHLYEDMLGPYATLLSEEDRQPVHERSSIPADAPALQVQVG
jgi:hypothetical protein